MLMNKKDELLELIQKPRNITRRNFLKGTGSLALFLSLPLDLRSVFAASPGASVIPDHITLTWSDNPATTQTIAWRTDTSVSTGLIQYAPLNGPASADTVTHWAHSVQAAVENLYSDLGEANLHAGMITGLTPGKKYAYRVGDGLNWSSAGTFTTQPAGIKKFTFLIFGDSQSGITDNPEYGPWKSNVHAAFAANPDARFFINVGDLTECGQYYTHWNHWYEGCQDIIRTIPAMPSQGNHETYNHGWLPPSGAVSEPYEYIEQFKLPQNGPQELRPQAYSWDYGNVHFTVIDSQYDEEVTAENGHVRFPGNASTPANPLANPFLRAQAEWLEKDLKNTNKEWKIVIFHKTPYYNKATRANETLKAAFCPIIEKYHVDVVLNGHDHGISRTYPIKGDVFQKTPGQGTVYYVTGRGGNKYYTDLSKKVWDQFFFDANDMPCYVVAQVNGARLTLSAIKQDGSYIDTYTIDKTTGTDFPATVLPDKYLSPQVIVYGNNSGVEAGQAGADWYIPLDCLKVSYRNSSTGALYENGSYAGGKTAYSLLKPNDFSADSSQVSFTYANTRYLFTVGSTTVGGSTKQLTKPARLQNGLVAITADDFYNLLGFSYRYDSSLNAIFLTK